ncbi:MAG: PIN domain-containing protein, partial [Chloroflexota bacterium]
AIRGISALVSPAFQIISLTERDRLRMFVLMQQYSDAELDFADTAQIAIAERLDITTIYTFDRRDFDIVRPAHCDYFDIRP